MRNDLISRSALKKYLTDYRWEFVHRSDFPKAIEIVDCAPAVDAVPVVHGRWEGTADGYADGELVYDMWACSECGYDADGADEEPDWKYCPNCGAKMDGGKANETD